MTESWATSSISMNEVKFNWKINNFSLMLNSSGGANRDAIRQIFSPSFMIGNEKCRRRTKQRELQSGGDYLVAITVESDTVNHVRMVGTITIAMKGEEVSGSLGDPTLATIQISPNKKDKNQVYKIRFLDVIRREQGHSYWYESRFYISRLATQLEMRVKLYFPSPITNSITAVPAKDSGLVKLSADMAALLNRSADCSDFTIECGGKTFPCHEFILRARSAVLDAMFQNKMEETRARRMTLVDVGPNTMETVLEYMYTGGMTVKVDNMKELIYIADKYEMEGLLDLCFRKLPEIGDDMVMDFLFMADKHNFVEYKKAAMVRINMNKEKLMENEEFVEKLKEVPSLLLELYKL